MGQTFKSYLYPGAPAAYGEKKRDTEEPLLSSENILVSPRALRVELPFLRPFKPPQEEKLW